VLRVAFVLRSTEVQPEFFDLFTLIHYHSTLKNTGGVVHVHLHIYHISTTRHCYRHGYRHSYRHGHTYIYIYISTVLNAEMNQGSSCRFGSVHLRSPQIRIKKHWRFCTWSGRPMSGHYRSSQALLKNTGGFVHGLLG